MKPKTHLDKDLEKLSQLAFHQYDKLADHLRQLYKYLNDPAHDSIHPQLVILRNWFLIPYSFWPIDFRGAAADICERLAAGESLDAETTALLDSLQNYPTPTAQRLVAANEHKVQRGDYDSFITSTARAKFEAKEKETLANPVLHKEWQEINAMYPVKELSDRKGIIRRRYVQERNFRSSDWLYTRATLRDRFQNRFDAFCHKHDLYGVEKDLPLLLKPSVSITAWGTLFFYPKWWSIDAARDFKTQAIIQLHKAHKPLRQGEIMSGIRSDRREKVKRILAANDKAVAAGKEGKDRYDFIIRHARLAPNTDPSYIRRLISEGEKLRKEGKL